MSAVERAAYDAARRMWELSDRQSREPQIEDFTTAKPTSEHTLEEKVAASRTRMHEATRTKPAP